MFYSLYSVFTFQEFIDKEMTDGERGAVHKIWHAYCARLDEMRGPMEQELARLRALAASHTTDWEVVLAGLETLPTGLAARGLEEVQDCAALAERQMNEALLLSIKLCMDLFLALKPIHAVKLQVALSPWLPDPVSMCRYLLRADRS